MILTFGSAEDGTKTFAATTLPVESQILSL